MFSHHRLQGYKAALAAANMPFDPVLVVEPHLTEEAGAAATLKLLARDDPPTAILCGNDSVAMGAMRAISETGRFPGQKIGIIGSDGNPFGATWSSR